MTKDHLVRLARIRRCTLILAVALMALTATASSAFAKEPTKGFVVFKQCPRFTPEVNLCLNAQTKSGEVTLNKQTVPITSTITLQGGIIRNEETEEEKFVGALNGETLSKTPQNVPGGLLGLINCTEIKGEGLLEKLARASCKAIFENKTTGVTATTELARPASEILINKNNLANEEGTALSLPVKVHLENPFLGSGCYIGSSAHPIVWNLTTGKTTPPPPNTSIMGTLGEIEFKEEFTMLEIIGNRLVDNSYAAPAASGCGGLFSFLIDPIINGKIGLPSAAGKNTTILNGNQALAFAASVIESEK